MPMNDLEVILFDLDGVIIDSEPCTKSLRQPISAALLRMIETASPSIWRLPITPSGREVDPQISPYLPALIPRQSNN
jgi:hypothetical protein